MKIVLRSLYLALLLGFLTAHSVQAAYVDPSTGGMLFQLLVIFFGLFSALILFFSARIKQVIFRARRFVRDLRSDDKADSKTKEANV